MQDVKKAARTWVRQQTRDGRRMAMPVIGLGLVNTAASVGQAGCLALALARMLTGQGVHFAYLAGFAWLALLRIFVGFAADHLAFEAGASGREKLRSDVVDRLLAAGPALLRGRHSAELATIAMDQVEVMDGLYARWVPATILALAGPAFVALVALAVDPVAAAIMVGAGLLVPVGQALAGIGAAAASRKQFMALSRLQARFLDRVRGIATIVLAGRADDEAAALGRAADELRRRTLRVLRVAFISSAMLDAAAALALVSLALRFRSALALHQGSPLGALFLLLLVPEFFAPLRAFAATYQDRLHATGAAEALVAIPPRPLTPTGRPPIRTVEAHGVSIVFQDVSLVWDETRGPALDHLSFTLPAGEMLVLAGPSGSGKSSVIELLLGFAKPTSGRILINGADIQDIVPAALAGMTAWIGQKPVLFAGSIRDNIRFAKPDANDEEIEAAARLAAAADFALSLPGGLDARIGEGGYGLSGGQAQRVAIARAFLKDAPLLLLDEPASHLDPATELAVLMSLRRLAVGRTVVMATHSAAAGAAGGRRLDLSMGRAVQSRGAA